MGDCQTTHIQPEDRPSDLGTSPVFLTVLEAFELCRVSSVSNIVSARPDMSVGANRGRLVDMVL